MIHIQVYRHQSELFRAAADYLSDCCHKSVESTGRCAVALPGGNTPRGLFWLLPEEPYRSSIPWPQVHFFWGDERCVPKNHPQSNYGLALESFLERLSIPPENLHPVVVEGLSAPQAAAVYERGLREFFRLRAGEYPSFDLILLGMGADGHTASLFPGGRELDVCGGLATWSQMDPASVPRVTFTLGTINSAQSVAFLVIGAGKSKTLRRVLEGDPSLPAARVKLASGRLVFFADEAAHGISGQER